MRKLTGMLSVVFCLFFLSGCSGRELEDREFPSVITVPTGKLESLQDMRQSDNPKFMDYSHAKAVIFHEDVVKNRDKLGQALAYFDAHPEFARNMLVFAGGDEELKKASEKKDEIGRTLQNYYKNQPGAGEKKSVTLMELWNYWNNQEKNFELPKVKVSGKKLMPEGEVRLGD